MLRVFGRLRFTDSERRSEGRRPKEPQGEAYLNRGLPTDKLVLGTRFIGTGWNGVTYLNTGLYQNSYVTFLAS